MILQRLLVAALLAGSLSASGTTNTAPRKLVTPEAHYSKIAKLVARDLPREHLTSTALDDQIAQKALERYLALLDYDKVFFTARDVAEFNATATMLDDELKRGELTFAYAVFETFKQRVRTRVAYVNTLLDKGFDFEVDESYRWRRKDAEWCADSSALNELWRRRVKNDYLRILVDRELRDEEATTNVPPSVAAGTPPPATEPPDGTAPVALDETDTASSTNTTNDAAEALAAEMAEELAKPPESIIRERYKQYLMTLEDSDSEWVLQKYLSAFSMAYDPHCEYMSPTSREDFNIEMKLSLVGIGAMLRPKDGTASIVRIIPGGPASRDKREIRLRPNDKIIAVAQGDEPPVSIVHWPLNKAVRLIRGKKGSTVRLTVIPASDKGGATTKIVDLVRDEVKLEENAAKSSIHEVELDGQDSLKLGTIKLPSFYADMRRSRRDPEARSATRDVARLLREFKEQDVDGVVLDLRSNGGGSLHEAVMMTGLFIRTGYTVQVRERRGISALPDNDPSIAYSGPLVVMVNRLSASASEILAGALQDYGRAIVVGDSKTHGKGSVQTILPLGRDPAMGSLKVTNGLFYRISGGSTQLLGVRPDIVVPSALEYMKLGEDTLPNALPWTQIPSVLYSPYTDLSALIPELQKRSLVRREGDERFQAYMELLARVEILNKQEELPLNHAARREKARSERELARIQNELLDREEASSEEDASEQPDSPAQPEGDETTTASNDEADADEKSSDLVLREGLHILADLVDLSPDAADAQSRAITTTDVHNILRGMQE
jgi:carboxyl-terminal processing protease